MRIFIGIIFLIISVSLLPLNMYAADTLFDHIKKADLSAFNDSTGSLSDWNIRDEKDNTLLLAALKTMLELETKYRGKTALHYAVLNNDVHMINLLIDSGADVTVKDENGDTPYLLARKSGYHEIADILFDCERNTADNITADNGEGRELSPEINDEYNDKRKNILSIIERILNSDININAADENGRNALHYSVLLDNYDISRRLIDKGIDVNLQDKLNSCTPLILAAKSGEWDIAGLLLENNADANLKEAAVFIKPEPVVNEPVKEPVYAKPEEYNFKFIVAGSRINDPNQDFRTYYQIAIDKQDQGRTTFGLDSQTKEYSGKLSVNSHLLTIEKYALDRKQERYVKLNNIDQPNPNYFYFDVPEDRIVIVTLIHDNENKTAEFKSEYEIKK